MSSRLHPASCSGHVVPTRTTSLPKPVIPLAGVSTSTFADHSIITDDYVEVASNPGGTSSRRVARGALQRQPPSEVHIPNAYPTVRQTGAFPVADTEEMRLMVDDDHAIIPQSNTQVLPPQVRRFLRSSSGTSSPPWAHVGKSTYRVYVRFRNKTNHAFEPIFFEGTAVHIGEGLFLSAAHNFVWLASNGYIHTSHAAEIYLRGGSGNLDGRGSPGSLSLISGLDIKCDVLEWPPKILADVVTQQLPIRGGLLDEHYDVPVAADCVLLKARPARWLARLRRRRRPYVLPGSLITQGAAVQITFVGINGRPPPGFEDYRKYNQQANTSSHYRSAIEGLLPGTVSCYSTSTATQLQQAQHYLLAGAGVTSTVLHYQLSVLPGSSGSGIYDTLTKRLVGLNSRSQTDTPTHIAGIQTSWNESNRTIATSLDGPEIRLFIVTSVVPSFMSIGTVTAINLAAEWARL